MNLSFVLHAHQPPGNFDWVFEHGFRVSYGPVLDLIEERPGLRVSMHWSGSLLEWMEEHVPDRIEQIRRLIDRGQVEMVAAGMYEPVLTLLPQRDRVGQLRAHHAYLKRLFGIETSVGWLTERVWEQSLVPDLVEGGITHVTLDDRHFYAAGVPDEDLDAPWLTEYQGHPLLVACCRGEIRAAIPWKRVDEALEVIRRRARSGAALLVYADDLEKFGMWPGTYEQVIRSGWLGEFFDGLLDLDLDASSDVNVLPLGEAMERAEVAGKTYIPDASYPEMLDWSLPVEARHQLEDVRQAISNAGLLEMASPYLRAGLYFQFLAKYPEVNHLHKRMVDVSKRTERLVRRLKAWDPERLPEPVRELWSAQANCAYWHGLFGGIYLPHIRQRLWHHLLRAEVALDRDERPAKPLRTFDLDADREDEFVVTTPDLVVVVDPSEGAVVELSHRSSAVNLVDTVARRREAYHDAGDDAPYPYDSGRRGVFLDRFLAPGRPPARKRDIEDLGDFVGQPYRAEAREDADGIEVVLDRRASTHDSAASVRKTVRVAADEPEVEAAYRITPPAGQALEARFGVEVNLGVLFRDKPRGDLLLGERQFALPSGGAARNVDAARLEMDGIDVGVAIEVDPPADVDVRPIETVSRSEGGFDRTAQQLAVLCSWPLRLKDQEEFTPTVRLRLVARGAK